MIKLHAWLGVAALLFCQSVFSQPRTVLAAEPTVLSLGDFEKGADGFNGAVKQDTSEGKIGNACAKMTNEKDKGWVEGRKTLPADLMYDFTEIRLWAKSTTAKTIAIRLADATGQSFQHRLGFKNDGQWQQLKIADLSASMEVWGGAGDKKWHGPCKSIDLILEGGNNEVQVDGIEAVLADKPIPELAAKAEALAKAEKVMIADFETNTDGFSGTIAQDASMGKIGKASGKIDNPGEKWVECGKKLDLTKDIAELHFWVRSTNATNIAVRLTDSTGQAFQHRPAFEADGNWQLIKLSDFAPGMESWGGAGDKKWHGPCKSIDLIVETKHSTVWVDGIEAIIAP